MNDLKATVLIDNISQNDLQPEWGLSIYIEYQGKKILLDTGASGRFLDNAKKLGFDLSRVDFAVLSHAHYDHADGMDAFFKENKNSVFYLRKGCGENCYGKKFIFRKYIGIQKGILKEYQDRIIFADGEYEIMPGVSLIPHKDKELSRIGKKNHLYVKQGHLLQPDDFSHEQSLVFDTDKGLVIFNSCSHGGADRIIREVAEAYPEKQIYALIGGFHLFLAPEQEVRALAAGIRETGIRRVYTGHCTGKKAYGILKDELGDMVQQLKTGLEISM